MLELELFRFNELANNFNNITLAPWKNETNKLAPKVLLVSNEGVLKIKMPETLLLPNKYF